MSLEGNGSCDDMMCRLNVNYAEFDVYVLEWTRAELKSNDEVGKNSSAVWLNSGYCTSRG